MGTEVKTGDKQANIAFISIKDSSDKKNVSPIKEKAIDTSKETTSKKKETIIEGKQDNDIVIAGEGIQEAFDKITNKETMPLPKKTAMSYINATSLRDLIRQVNDYNEFYPDCPILKEDVVSVLKEGEGYVLLYYRYGK